MEYDSTTYIAKQLFQNKTSEMKMKGKTSMINKAWIKARNQTKIYLHYTKPTHQLSF